MMLQRLPTGCAFAALLLAVLVTAQSPQSQIFPALASLSPRPSSWQLDSPLEHWDGFSQCTGSSGLYALNFSSSFLTRNGHWLSTNNTLALNLLSTTVPLCAIIVAPPVNSALRIVFNISALPASLVSLKLSGNLVVTNSPWGTKTVTLTNKPSGLNDIDLSNCGLEGVVDVTKATNGANGMSAVYNFSFNVGIIGAVDVVQSPLCGLMGTPAGLIPLITFDFLGTSISLVAAGSGSQGANCIGQPADAASRTVTMFVEDSVTTLPVDPLLPETIDYGYYCQSPQASSSQLPLLQYRHVNGLDELRAMNPPFECSMILTSIFSSVSNGYVYDSPAYAGGLYPCVPNTTLYFSKQANYVDEVASIDSNGNLTFYGPCPDEASSQGNDVYFSVSIGQTAFLDFISTGLSVTARGLHDGHYHECTFPWHYFVQPNVAPPSYEHIIYNDQQILVDLSSCLPTTAANGTLFSSWASVRLSQNENHLRFRDTAGNTLELARFAYSLVYPGTYCFQSRDVLYQLQVSSFFVNLSQTSADGTVLASCQYNGIFQFLTLESVGLNTFYAFDDVMAAIGPCMPSNNNGSHWSATASHLEFYPGSVIAGNLLFYSSESDGGYFNFSNSSCAVTPAPGVYCSSVDFFTGTLFLTVAENRTAMLQYIQTDSQKTLSNLTTCNDLSFPLWFDASGTMQFLADVRERWQLCFPRATPIALFGDNVTSITLTSRKSGSGILLVSNPPSADDTSSVELTAAACNSTLPLSAYTYCPKLEHVNNSLTQSEYCIFKYCRPFVGVQWEQVAVAGNTPPAWKAGHSEVGLTIPLVSLSKVSNVSGTLTACYPPCYVDTRHCEQVAYVLDALLFCYLRRGQVLTESVLPAIPANCQNHTGVVALLNLIRQFDDAVSSGGQNDLGEPVVEVQCLQDGQAVLTSSHPSRDLFTLYWFNVRYGEAAQSAATGGLSVRCTTCETVWLRNLYPTPLVLIALNAMMNMLFVIVANYVVQPLIGPAVARLKVKTMVALGGVSRREARSYEVWLRACFKPYVASAAEVQYHIDSVLKIVNAERKRIIALQDSSSSSDVSDSEPPAVNVDPSINEDCGDDSRGNSRKGHGRKSKTPREETRRAPITQALSHGKKIQENLSEMVDGDARFKKVYEEHLMCGNRMLLSVGEICLRKLVDLRNACSCTLQPVTRTGFIRFPVRKSHDSFMTEMTAENLLMLHEKMAVESDALLSSPSSSSFSQFSTTTNDLQVEDAIVALENDATAEWTPFVFPNEWMDRQFLSPKDWLLTVQLVYTLVIFGKTFDSAVSNSGAQTSWELFSAFYFYFLSSSSPVSLLINAVFRVMYSKNIVADVTEKKFGYFKAYIKTYLKDPFVVFSALLVMPGLLAHCVLGLLAFPFLIVGSLLVVVVAARLRVAMPEVDESKGKLKSFAPRTVACIATRIIFRQTVMFVAIASVQMSYDYSILLWAGQLSWPEIVSFEFNARSLACTLETLQRGANGAWHMFYSQFA